MTKQVLKIESKCSMCTNIVVKSEKYRSKRKNLFCSKQCFINFGLSKYTKINCTQCNKEILKANKDIKRTKNNFCSWSCNATYYHQNKKFGYKRSKLEVWIETKLKELYSNLEIHYNRKDTIDSELDIYIPSLKLAFELNGIFHYEPIFGEKQLKQKQNNDNRKFQACLEKQIELCIIDVSKAKKFKPERDVVYLNIIDDIIKQKLNYNHSPEFQ